MLPATSEQGSSSRSPTDQIPNYELVRKFGGRTESVSVVKFSHCGNYLASSSAFTVRIWSIADAKRIQELTGHKDQVNDVSWSSDNNYVVSASDDKRIKIFRVSTATCSKTLTGHNAFVRCCSFNPQGSLVASGSFDRSVRIWDVKTGECVKVLQCHSMVFSVNFDRFGSLICSGSDDGFARIWDVSNGELVKTLGEDDEPPASCVKFSENGKLVLVSYIGGIIKLWSFKEEKCLKVYTGHQTTRCFDYANYLVTGGQYIICGSDDSKVYIWDLNSVQIVQTLKSHTTRILAIDCHSNEGLIVTVGYKPDCVIRLWKRSFLQKKYSIASNLRSCKLPSTSEDKNAAKPTAQEEDSNQIESIESIVEPPTVPEKPTAQITMDPSDVWLIFGPKDEDGESECSICKGKFSAKNPMNVMQHLTCIHEAELERKKKITMDPSDVWLIFGSKDKDGESECSICKGKFSAKNPMNVMQHLTCIHEAELERKKKERDEEKSREEYDRLDLNKQNQKFRELLTRLVVTENLPYSIVENPDFRSLIQFLNSEIGNISSDTVAQDIKRIEVDYAKECKNKFSKVENLVITTDGWSNCDGQFQLYCLVVAFWKDSVICQQLIGCVESNSGKTDDIIVAVNAVLKKTGITFGSIHGFITNSDSNFISMARKTALDHVPCGCHQLHLAIGDAMHVKEVDLLMEKAKTIATLLAQSSIIREEFIDVAGYQKNKNGIPQNFSPTRWLGCRMLLKSIQKHYSTIACTSDLASYIFSHSDKKIIEFVQECTNSLENATMMFECETTNASEIIPRIKICIERADNTMKKFQAPDAATKKIAEKFHASLVESLRKRLQAYCSNYTVSIATFIDPRFFKHPKFIPAEFDYRTTEESILELFSNEKPQAEVEELEDEAPLPKKRKIDDLDEYDEDKDDQISSISQREEAEMELTKYSAYVLQYRIPRSENPMRFWTMQEEQFPRLSTIAKRFLLFPASAANTERVFSNAGRIVANRLKNRTSSATLSANLFVLAKFGYERKNSDGDGNYGIIEDDNADNSVNGIQENPVTENKDFAQEQEEREEDDFQQIDDATGETSEQGEQQDLKN